MTKQEQIEEMEKIIDELYNVYDTTAGDIAEGLYNAGYRKVPFNIRHLFDEIERKMKFKTDFGTIDFTEEQILFIEQAICGEEEKIRKETAKEIVEQVKGQSETFLSGLGNGTYVEKDYVSVEYIEELAKQFGLEVEE